MQSTQSGGKYGPWKDHYEEMGRKTLIPRLSKYLPMSIEMANASALDERADAGKTRALSAALDGGDFVVSAAYDKDDGAAAEATAEIDPETGEVLTHQPTMATSTPIQEKATPDPDPGSVRRRTPPFPLCPPRAGAAVAPPCSREPDPWKAA